MICWGNLALISIVSYYIVKHLNAKALQDHCLLHQDGSKRRKNEKKSLLGDNHTIPHVPAQGAKAVSAPKQYNSKQLYCKPTESRGLKIKLI